MRSVSKIFKLEDSEPRTLPAVEPLTCLSALDPVLPDRSDDAAKLRIQVEIEGNSVYLKLVPETSDDSASVQTP